MRDINIYEMSTFEKLGFISYICTSYVYITYVPNNSSAIIFLKILMFLALMLSLRNLERAYLYENRRNLRFYSKKGE